jgi:hypothetical protein
MDFIVCKCQVEVNNEALPVCTNGLPRFLNWCPSLIPLRRLTQSHLGLLVWLCSDIVANPLAPSSNFKEDSVKNSVSSATSPLLGLEVPSETATTNNHKKRSYSSLLAVQEPEATNGCSIARSTIVKQQQDE